MTRQLISPSLKVSAPDTGGLRHIVVRVAAFKTNSRLSSPSPDSVPFREVDNAMHREAGNPAGGPASLRPRPY